MLDQAGFSVEQPKCRRRQRPAAAIAGEAVLARSRFGNRRALVGWNNQRVEPKYVEWRFFVEQRCQCCDCCHKHHYSRCSRSNTTAGIQLFRNHELQGVLLQVHSGVLRRTVTAATSSTAIESPAIGGLVFVTKTAGQVQAVGRELLVRLDGSSFSKYGSGKTWPDPNYKRAVTTLPPQQRKWQDTVAASTGSSGFHRINFCLLRVSGRLLLLPWLEHLLLLLDSPPRLVLVLPPL
ncbi:uncharacterized protein LOC9645683 [Selaginella moellendorffii]|nr:uncharacterized protein LOC9645683 [Selaginella moellendorffii]|eukprot:XP_024530787.1 uncharacterized protein LOC9645683 [Selaginella moellendorffii]